MGHKKPFTARVIPAQPNTGAVMNSSIASLIARIAMALLFLPSGLFKIAGYSGTAGYMDSQGVPGVLLPAVIAVEVLGGLALLVGFQTRLAAWALAAFTLLAAILFHRNLGDQMQSVMFFKNIAITGGLLALAALGAGEYSVEGRRA
jgi:putative oxidoreductase